MCYRASGFVICSCLSLYLLMACHSPSQLQQTGPQTETDVATARTVPFQAKNITAPPEGITAPPQNITAPPQGITAPPQNITAPPEGITAPPQNLWANAALKPLQMALANYHEVDASFYDAYRLQQDNLAGNYRTQLLGWVKETVTGAVHEIQETVETIVTDSNAEGVLQVPLVQHLLALDLEGLLSRLLPLPTQSLYRLQSRPFEAQQASETVMLPGDIPANLAVLQLTHALRERQIVTLTPMETLDHEGGQRLSESGAGFSQQATRTHQWVSGQWRLLTQVVTTWDNGDILKISEERLSSAEGVGTGQGVMEFTPAEGSSQRFTFSTQTASEGALWSQIALERDGVRAQLNLKESASGTAVFSYQDEENARVSRQLDFDIMVTRGGEAD